MSLVTLFHTFNFNRSIKKNEKVRNIHIRCRLIHQIIILCIIPSSWRMLADQKTRLLVREYLEKMAAWESVSKALEKHHHKSRESLDQWPTEMLHFHPIKTKDGQEVLAPDQSIYLEDVDFNSSAF
jgi:hypothetical protein